MLPDERDPGQLNNAQGIDTHWTPSQAEGDRETAERDLERKFGGENQEQRSQ